MIENPNKTSYNINRKADIMTEPEEKKETLEEKYARVFDCDPSDEEVLASYDDKFNKEIDEI